MLIIEFSSIVKEENNNVLYRDINDNIWNSIKVNLITLNLLLQNFGYNAMYIGQAIDTYLDNIHVKYYDSDIKLLVKGFRNIKNMPGKY
jgi:hypothetical protein